MSRALAVVPTEILRPGERTLNELAEDFRREHEQVLSSAVQTVEHAIRAGAILLAAKKKVPHGDWYRWLDEHIIGDGRRLSTVNAYMRFARNASLLRREQPATFKGAALLLRGSHDTRLDPLVRDTARRLRGEGWTQKQIAEELGISVPSVWRLTNPESYERSRRKSAKRTQAAKVALRQKEREEAMRASSSDALSEAYALTRRALQLLDRAVAEDRSVESKRHVSSAIGRLHAAEDQIVRGERTADVDKAQPSAPFQESEPS